MYYNWACHSRIICDWVHSYLTGGPEPLEAWECAPHALIAELTNIGKSRPRLANNLIISNTIKVWKAISSFSNRRYFPSYLTPIRNNRNFPSGVKSVIFRNWYDKGIRVIGDLFDDSNVLMSSEMIEAKYGLTRIDFHAYFQVRHFILTDCKFPQDKPLLGPMEEAIIRFNGTKGFISYFYNHFISYDPQNIDLVVKKWETDLQTEYEKDSWDACIQSSHSTFLGNRYNEMQYRILHRQHRTPYFLNKIDCNRSPLCIKCKKEVGTYIHCFWKCSKIVKFWTCVTKELNVIFKCKICKDPGQFLLGLPSKTGVLDPRRSKLLNKLLLLARKCILFNWIQDTQWYREIFRVLPMERLSAKLKGKDDIFLNLWWPLISYLPRDLSAVINRGNDSLEG